MAYVSKEDKAKFVSLLKKEFGSNAKKRGFKYTVAIRNFSTIVVNISGGSIDFIGSYKHRNEHTESIQVNPYSVADSYTGKAKEVLVKIVNILNTDNYDNSDVMTDYFDVGHYVEINIGKWNKPYNLVK
jgi:hypothetical protein